MHLAGVGASPSSDSLALSHLGDDSWWHLPLVPRPPSSEAITVVFTKQNSPFFPVKTATPKKQKKKETARACRCIYIPLYLHTFLEYTPPLHIFPWLPVTTCWLHQILQLPTAMLSGSGNHRIKSPSQGFRGSWFFWGEIVIGKPPQKTNKQTNCKNFLEAGFFLKNSPISMYITC